MKNFEEITYQITDEEKRIAEILVQRFKEKTGKSKKVTNNQIVSGLKKQYNIETNGARIRKIINYIRNKGLLTGLIATSSGYWTTSDPEELRSWLESMKQREEAIRQTRLSGERDLMNLTLFNSVQDEEEL